MASPEPPRHGARQDLRSIPELMGDLVQDLTGLFKSEGRLIRAEITEAGQKLAHGGELIAVGAVLLLVALLVLVQALVIWLSEFVGPGLAALIVGGALALIGVILALAGRSKLSSASLTPDRTINQIQQDIRLKEKI
ncbi:phage holin family protein [soil metagenome]